MHRKNVLFIQSMITKMLFLFFGLALPALSLHAAEAPTKRVRHNEFFSTSPGSSGEREKVGFWTVADPEKGAAKAENAGLLLTIFKKANPKRTKNGIFIYSLTHSMEWTAPEKARYAKTLTEQLLNDKAWHTAENKLVDELVNAANAEGVPVWVLLRGSSSGNTGLATYKLLTDPKLTLKN